MKHTRIRNKLIVFIILLATSSFNNKSTSNDGFPSNGDNPILGNDYTFCYGSIALTLYENETVKQVRYGVNGTILKILKGKWNAYGTSSPQTIKIKFESADTEYSYELIHDGFGKPSVLIDGEGRRYTICSGSNIGKTNSFPDLTTHQPPPLPKVVSRPEFTVSKTKENIYLVTNKKTSSLVFYFATDNLYCNNQQCRLGYENAKALCENIKIRGKENWRLPTFSELEIIYGFSFNRQITPQAKGEMYWSSTKSDKNPNSAVKGIDFKTGSIIDGVVSTGQELGWGFERLGYTYAVKDFIPATNQQSEKNEKADVPTTLKDSRDGRTYKVVKIGTQIWMAENLAFLPFVNPASENSVTESKYYVYDYQGKDIQEALKTENFKKYGVLYNWAAAINELCPTGWHLPDKEEWKKLINYYSYLKVSSSYKEESYSPWKLKGDSIIIGFDALPAGYKGTPKDPRDNVFGTPDPNKNYGAVKAEFEALGYSASFWSSSSFNSETSIKLAMAWVARLGRGDKEISFNNYEKVMALSCRCIKDDAAVLKSDK